MLNVNVTLDLYGSAVCLILTCYLLSGKRCCQKSNLYFAVICGMNICMQLCDIPNWLCEGYGRSWYPAALKIGSFFYFLCAAPMLWAYTEYIAEFLSPKIKIHKRFRDLVFWLGMIYTICVILTPANGMFYRIVQGNIYSRGKWFWLSQTIPFVIYIMDILMVYLYRKFMSKKELFLFLSYVFLPGIAEVIQIRFYGIALLNTGITASLLLIFINLQSERELMMKQQKAELAEARIDIMISQINPHFLYNALTTIRYLCGKDPVQAKRTVTDFSLFLRSNMDSLTNKMPISFEKELGHTESYLNLEKQRFGKRLSVEYNIKVRNFTIPPLTLQPIVENAVRHGIMRKEEGGTVTIGTEETKDAYLISVSDNGEGFTYESETEGSGGHIGISNVKYRLCTMCGGKLNVESSLGMGTMVLMEIPKNNGISFDTEKFKSL